MSQDETDKDLEVALVYSKSGKRQQETAAPLICSIAVGIRVCCGWPAASRDMPIRRRMFCTGLKASKSLRL